MDEVTAMVSLLRWNFKSAFPPGTYFRSKLYTRDLKLTYLQGPEKQEHQWAHVIHNYLRTLHFCKMMGSFTFFSKHEALLVYLSLFQFGWRRVSLPLVTKATLHLCLESNRPLVSGGRDNVGRWSLSGAGVHVMMRQVASQFLLTVVMCVRGQELSQVPIF